MWAKAQAATLYNPVFAVVTRRYPQDFRRAIITLTFLGGLASTMFIPLSAWLISAFGWRHALWVLAALHLMVCASLNGAHGVPTALARAVSPWLLGVLWTRDAGYRYGLAVLLAGSCVAVVALLLAQRRALVAAANA